MGTSVKQKSASPSAHLAAVLCLLGMLAGVAPGAGATTPEEARLIQNTAVRGNDGAQVLLALVYLDGQAGYPQDAARAAYWFDRAAQQNNAYAQMMLGELYADGRGVSRDPAKSLLWRERAARQGSARAQAALGEMYLRGEGVSAQPAAAEEWLGKAADQGDAHAQYLLAGLYRSGYGGPGNLQRGKNWLERAAAQGHSETLRLLYYLLEFGADAGAVQRQHEQALHARAGAGEVEAQYQLALRFETGAWGFDRDDARALHWFNRAAEGGHRGAMASLAHIYRDGLLGVAPDRDIAARWERRAQQAPSQ